MPTTPTFLPPEPVPSDAQLVARAGNGNTLAFRCLMERYEKRVTSFACRLLGGDVVTAEDVSQEIWIGLWQALGNGRYVEQGYLSAYLFRAVRNRCRDLARSARPTLALSEFDKAIAPPAPISALQDALAALPEAQRVALLLHHYDGASYAEIAETLGCAPGTVASRLHTARATLKRLLTEETEI